MSISTRQAALSDLDRVAPLFDLYRQFYGKPADPALSRGFLLDRFRHFESTIFLAFENEDPAGFIQLYPRGREKTLNPLLKSAIDLLTPDKTRVFSRPPSFSSVSAARIFILNDLFVHPAFRKKGLGKALLEKAREFGNAHFS